MNRTISVTVPALSMLLFSLLCLPPSVFAQFIVDCSGNTPGAYTTINSVLPLLSNGAVVQITGTCTENVTIANLNNLWMGAPWGETMNLHGNLSINGSQNLFIYGMNVSSSPGDGIDINSSSGIELDTCSSTSNSSTGLSEGAASFVSVQNTGTFSNNASTGIALGGNSVIQFLQWGGGGPIDISNNVGTGLSIDRSVVIADGNVIITNTRANPPSASSGITAPNGFGISFAGASRGLFVAFGLPNTISGNAGGGISLIENSELSLCCNFGPPGGAWQTTVVEGNGPVGISVGFGSQLTFDDGVQVSNHADAGIDVYGRGQIWMNGNNQITNNGTGPAATYPVRAGLRVDGNSEAYIRGGQISQNGGPGIFALVNSSLDLSGVTFASNGNGPLECDSSAWMVSEPAPLPFPGAVTPCKIPNTFPARTRSLPLPPFPNWTAYKASETKYQQLMAVLKRPAN